MVITAIFLAEKVYDVAKGIADKRDAMIDVLTARGVSPEVAAARADDMVGRWLAEEIGKVVIEEGLDAVLDQISVTYPRAAAKDAIIEAWKTFIKKAETGTWERGVVR